MVLPGKEDLAPVNDRMVVGESVDMPVEYDPLPDQVGIFEIIAALYIISYVIPDDDFIRITRQVDMCQDIHIAI
jgi:hypothetical protein